MQHYPIFIDLKLQAVLIVGGGEVALRKARLMASAGAHITVIAPHIHDEFHSEQFDGLQWLEREFNDDDISGYRLITAATNDKTLNRRISELAQQQNIPVNVVDQPELCSFITPSIIDRDPVTVAISTSGTAPVLARLLRSKLEAFIPSSYGKLASALHQIRDKVKQAIPEEKARRTFWETVIQGDIAELFFAGKTQAGKEKLDQALSNPDTQSVGNVALVGAGPGDPDLLTFRALRLMQQADIVFYDRLVSKTILDLVRRDAEKFYVGKQRANHAVAQGDINQRLLEQAQQGKNVVRLKGGDPFIFGRGGEEIEHLAQYDVPFQIVPGITAASGCATYAGIPLTHRDHAKSCLFVTGHLKDGSVDLDWPLLATPEQTVVIYMGLVGLPTICAKLIEHGVDEDMPIALICKGTTQNQQVLTGTLATMPELVKNKGIHAPTLIIIGSVVSLQPTLAWFEP